MNERAFGTTALLLAALVAGAGVVHLTAAPDVGAERVADGVALALVGWLQLALAVALVVQPERRVLLATVVVNGAALLVWAASRSVGLPFGVQGGEVQDVGAVDLLGATFEGLAALGAVFLLARAPDRSSFRLHPAVLGLAAVPALLVVAATTVVIASSGDDSPGSEPAGAAATGAGHGSHGGTAGGLVPWQNVTDPEVRARLAEELVAARGAAAQWPTAGDAAEAGYVQVTPFVEHVGAHWMRFDVVDDAFDPAEPEMLLFAGDGPDAPLAGVSYYVVAEDGADLGAPDGFAGPNDRWSTHLAVCLDDDGVLGPESMGEAACRAAGGEKADGPGRWSVTAWVVPGWENPTGTFQPVHPDVT